MAHPPTHLESTPDMPRNNVPGQIKWPSGFSKLSPEARLKLINKVLPDGSNAVEVQKEALRLIEVVEKYAQE